MLDVKKFLDEIKESPYEEFEVRAPHTGHVEFILQDTGEKVSGPSGTYMEKPGTLLATLEREHNKKNIYADRKGVISSVNLDLNKKFIQAGEALMTIRHFLSKQEVVNTILRRVLNLFNAPERAKYYFVPEVDKKVKASGPRSVKVFNGMELFIVSRMKRETPLVYTGPEGQIYAVYFNHTDNVEMGQPLIGVCPKDQLGAIQSVINRVQNDWEESD